MDRAAGMYNVVIKVKGLQRFKVLVGFDLAFPWPLNIVVGWITGFVNGFDYFGVVESNDDGEVVFQTYLGKGSVDFEFLFDQGIKDFEVTISSSEDDQNKNPSAVFLPHIWQRYGFFG